MTLIITFSAGCAVKGLNLAKSGEVSVERKHTKNIYFSYITVYQNGENISVSGKVKNRFNFKRIPMGHIDVTIISPAGTILKKVGVLHYPRRLPRKRAGSSYFKVDIPVTLPLKAIVRVEYHNNMSIPPEVRLPKEKNGSQYRKPYRKNNLYKFSASVIRSDHLLCS